MPTANEGGAIVADALAEPEESVEEDDLFLETGTIELDTPAQASTEDAPL